MFLTIFEFDNDLTVNFKNTESVGDVPTMFGATYLK